mgnify:CR=1 FL=1
MAMARANIITKELNHETDHHRGSVGGNVPGHWPGRGRDAPVARSVRVAPPGGVADKARRIEPHLRDIAGILMVSGDTLDREYLAAWAARLDLTSLWSQVLVAHEKRR